MSSVFQKVKHYPKMQRVVEDSLTEKLDSATQVSCHMGKVAALKAQRRIIEGNKSQLKKLLQKAGK